MIKVIRTALRTHENWSERMPLDFCKAEEKDAVVAVFPKKTFQTHLGFGGAFTDAAVITASQNGNADRIIKAYFSQDGLGYNLGRVPIHSTDFGPKSYTYIEDNDAALKTFDMSCDDEIKVPFMQKAVKEARGLKLLASAWSPPAFMKTNRDLYYGGRLKGEYYDAWANYMVEFLRGMKKRGLQINALTMQNEPEAVQVWESREMSAKEEADFIKVLAPKLKGEFDDVKLIIWDHNRDRMVQRSLVTLEDEEVRNLVWGIGYHWYVCDRHENLALTHELFPEKHILFTEGCVEMTNTAVSSKGSQSQMGSWEHGERYAKNIICDYNNHCEGWLDWNLCLNETGGPTHVDNYCEAPIMVDSKTGEITKNPSYYYIGHFSKFVRPGAKRVQCMCDTDEVYATAFVNPDSKPVVVVMNTGWVKNIKLLIDGNELALNSPAHSIITLMF